MLDDHMAGEDPGGEDPGGEDPALATANEPVFYLCNADPDAVRILFRACIPPSSAPREEPTVQKICGLENEEERPEKDPGLATVCPLTFLTQQAMTKFKIFCLISSLTVARTFRVPLGIGAEGKKGRGRRPCPRASPRCSLPS